jgi:hypothetical protein
MGTRRPVQPAPAHRIVPKIRAIGASLQLR